MSSSLISTPIDCSIDQDRDVDATDGAPFVVHLLATPRWAAVTRFQSALRRTLLDYPGVPVQVSGAAKNDSHLELTFGISMGPAATVSDWSDEAVAALNLINRLMDELLDYAPRFVATPDDAHADAAITVAPHFGLTSTLPLVVARAA